MTLPWLTAFLAAGALAVGRDGRAVTGALTVAALARALGAVARAVACLAGPFALGALARATVADERVAGGVDRRAVGAWATAYDG